MLSLILFYFFLPTNFLMIGFSQAKKIYGDLWTPKQHIFYMFGGKKSSFDIFYCLLVTEVVSQSSINFPLNRPRCHRYYRHLHLHFHPHFHRLPPPPHPPPPSHIVKLCHLFAIFGGKFCSQLSVCNIKIV